MYKGKFKPQRNCAKFTNDEMSTVAQLLDLIEKVTCQEPEITPDEVKMRISRIRRSADFICRHIGQKQVPARTPTESLLTCGTDLAKSVKRVKSYPIRILYVGQWKLLVEFAKALGFQHEILNLEREWDRLGCIVDSYNRTLINDLKAKGIHPQEVSQEHLDAWQNCPQNQKLSSGRIEQSISQFKYQIRRANLQSEFPNLNVDSACGKRFSVPMKKMSPEVREELTAILEWLAEQNRRETIRMSERTRKNITVEIERLYGFSRDYYPPLHGKPLTSLDEMLKRPVVKAFVRWLHKEHKYSRASLNMVVFNLRSMLKAHPAFENRDWEWMVDLLKEFREEPESKVEQRREERAFDYNMATLRLIPDMLRERRESAKGLTRIKKAWMIHDELLMLFLTTYPWPPRCLRECRVSGDSPNLMKKSPGDGLQKVWYFYFHPEEVPRRRLATGPLPKKLVPTLNLYLRYRRDLVKDTKVNTLFLNRTGEPLTQLRFVLLVKKLTRSTVGKPVPPIGFRDAHGYEWLVKKPGDFGTLASLRWETEYWVKMRFDRDFRNKERAKWAKNKAEGRAHFGPSSRSSRRAIPSKTSPTRPKLTVKRQASTTKRSRIAVKPVAA